MATRDNSRASQPGLSPSEAAGTEPSTAPTSAVASPPTALRKVEMPELVLRTTLWRLRIARSAAITAAMALAHQNADVDADIASVLRKHVVDALTTEIDALQEALGIDVHNVEADAQED